MKRDIYINRYGHRVCRKTGLIVGNSNTRNIYKLSTESFESQFVDLERKRLTIESPDNAAAFTVFKEKLDDVLNTLTDREETVMRVRFGLVDGYCWTLEEVGRFFNVTRECVRQIEAKALRKMRHPKRARELKPFLNWRV